jgi:hypothetical protein
VKSSITKPQVFLERRLEFVPLYSPSCTLGVFFG